MRDFLEDIKNNKPVNGAILPPRYITYSSEDISSVDKAEALKYTGVPKREKRYVAELDNLCDDTIKEVLPTLTYRVSYATYALDFSDDGYPVLPFEQHSDNLKSTLAGCCGVVLFSATIGPGIDRLISRYEKISPARGVLMQGLGAERVEALCDKFCHEIDAICGENGLSATMRYSPGYGDLPLEVQPEFLRLTDATRRCGITLGASLLMAPTKSVTAIVGIKKD